MIKKFIKYFLLLFLLISNLTKAENLNIYSIGSFDFNKQKNEAIDIRFEKRFDKIIFDLGPQEEPLYFIKPFIGIEATSDSAIYGLGGFYVEEKIGKNFFLTPNIGAGLYHRGDGKDLGHIIEFKSEVQLSLDLLNNSQLGISYNHISNASLGDKNPGANSYMFNFLQKF